uniref:Metallo-beta-lactamase domain-containing protein n=1 Tax=Amphimedon queenslandica TaxID=400682 RepID=A0A1X7TYV2_AMPQE
MKVILVIALLIQVSLSLEIPDADDKLHIYALPLVGGCTVIQCPKGEEDGAKGAVTIIDTGKSSSNSIGGKDVKRFLSGTTIKHIFLTNSNKNSRKYFKDILNSFKQYIPVHHPCSWKSYDTGSKYAQPKEIQQCSSISECDYEIELCPGVTISVVAAGLGECKGRDDGANNIDSLIAKMTYTGADTYGYGTYVTALFSGNFEASGSVVSRLIEKAGEDLSADIYRLSNEGNYPLANSRTLLNAIKARYVFTSSEHKKSLPRCEIYDYYKTNDNIDHVERHPYTCYDANKKLTNIDPEVALYGTNVYQPDEKKYKKVFFVLDFSINSSGDIGVKMTNAKN